MKSALYQKILVLQLAHSVNKRLLFSHNHKHTNTQFVKSHLHVGIEVKIVA